MKFPKFSPVRNAVWRSRTMRISARVTSSRSSSAKSIPALWIEWARNLGKQKGAAWTASKHFQCHAFVVSGGSLDRYAGIQLLADTYLNPAIRQITNENTLHRNAASQNDSTQHRQPPAAIPDKNCIQSVVNVKVVVSVAVSC